MIPRTKPLFFLWLLLTLGLLTFIWGNSLMPAEDSSQLSGWFGQLIGKVFPIFSPDSPNGSHLLRKCAHFCEFAALGAVLCFGWAMVQVKKRCILFPALGCGILVAAIDETIQRFVPGRSGAVTDVLLDSSGVLAGAACLFLILILYKEHKGGA